MPPRFITISPRSLRLARVAALVLFATLGVTTADAQPASHENTAFRTLMIVAGLFVLYLIFLWRVRQIRAHERELEDLVQQRTSELERANMRLDQVSKTDYLTSLANRRGFVEVASREMKRVTRTLEPLSIALCDIDRFKALNDEFGHDFGDVVLENTATFLLDQVRETDLVARWGGEEFIFLLPNTDLKGGRTIAEKILENLKALRFVKDGKEIEITLTFGVCQIESGMRLDEAVKHADEALYEGKQEGGARVVVWEIEE